MWKGKSSYPDRRASTETKPSNSCLVWRKDHFLDYRQKCMSKSCSSGCFFWWIENCKMNKLRYQLVVGHMGGNSKLPRKRGGNLGGKTSEKNQVATWEEQLLRKSKQNWKFQGMYLYLSSNLPSLICPGNPDIGSFRLFDNLLPVRGSHLLPSPSHLKDNTIYYPFLMFLIQFLGFVVMI